jgi:hypothetical protein
LDSLELKKSAIQEWFAECLSIEDVVDMYGELLHELRTQYKYMIRAINREMEEDNVECS